MTKTFVLDTNVLLHNANSIESFEDNTVLLPIEVLEELDQFKTRNDELGKNARQVIRRLDDLRQKGCLKDGVSMSNGGTLKVSVIKIEMDSPLDIEITDNKILMVAYQLQRTESRVIFVSNDINARLKADAIGLETSDFQRDKVSFKDLYTGQQNLLVEGSDVDEFYDTEEMSFEGNPFLPNEFILLQDESNPKHSALSKAVNSDTVQHLCGAFEKAYGIKPRSKEQRMAMELLMDPQIQLVTLVGQAGTGKTLLALAAGLELAEKSDIYDKVLVGRPIIPFGKDIGFLPGDKDEKLNHWMQPIFDNLTYLMTKNYKSRKNGEIETERSIRKQVEDLFSRELLELEALTYIRGRSIPRQFIIVDEAQNLSPHEVKTIISRAGEGSKVVLTGDPYQIDNPYLDACSNGLIYAAEKMKGEAIHGHIVLKRSERSKLAGVAARLL